MLGIQNLFSLKSEEFLRFCSESKAFCCSSTNAGLPEHETCCRFKRTPKDCERAPLRYAGSTLRYGGSPPRYIGGLTLHIHFLHSFFCSGVRAPTGAAREQTRATSPLHNPPNSFSRRRELAQFVFFAVQKRFKGPQRMVKGRHTTTTVSTTSAAAPPLPPLPPRRRRRFSSSSEGRAEETTI